MKLIRVTSYLIVSDHTTEKEIEADFCSFLQDYTNWGVDPPTTLRTDVPEYPEDDPDATEDPACAWLDATNTMISEAGATPAPHRAGK